MPISDRGDPPFPRGQTWYDGATISTSNYGGLELEGKMWVFEDVPPNIFPAGTAGQRQARTNRPVMCMCVRNVSGINLLPMRLVRLQRTAGIPMTGRVDGYTYIDGDEGYPVDEYLPAAGVPNGDLFWVVVEGPALCLTDLAGGANNSIAVGDILCALTAATSQATTAGRVEEQSLTGATAPLGNQIQNRLGRALSALTTSQTNVGILVDLRKW